MMKSVVFGCVYIFCIVINNIQCYYGAEDLITSFEQHTILSCTDLSPQRSVNIEQVVGTWYGYEIFIHRNDSKNNENLNPCVVVELSGATYEAATERSPEVDTGFEEYHNRQVFQYDLPHQEPYGSQYFHYLKLVWSEQGKKIDYTLRYNTSRPALWYVSAPQRGTMQKLNYGQFDGTIQALRTNENYMLLTFCLDRLFSIILTREPKILATADLQNARILLKHRGLSVTVGRGDCNASNATRNRSILVLIATTTIQFLFKQL